MVALESKLGAWESCPGVGVRKRVVCGWLVRREVAGGGK